MSFYEDEKKIEDCLSLIASNVLENIGLEWRVDRTTEFEENPIPFIVEDKMERRIIENDIAWWKLENPSYSGPLSEIDSRTIEVWRIEVINLFAFELYAIGDTVKIDAPESVIDVAEALVESDLFE